MLYFLRRFQSKLFADAIDGLEVRQCYFEGCRSTESGAALAYEKPNTHVTISKTGFTNNSFTSLTDYLQGSGYYISQASSATSEFNCFLRNFNAFQGQGMTILISGDVTERDDSFSMCPFDQKGTYHTAFIQTAQTASQTYSNFSQANLAQHDTCFSALGTMQSLFNTMASNRLNVIYESVGSTVTLEKSNFVDNIDSGSSNLGAFYMQRNGAITVKDSVMTGNKFHQLSITSPGSFNSVNNKLYGNQFSSGFTTEQDEGPITTYEYEMKGQEACKCFTQSFSKLKIGKDLKISLVFLVIPSEKANVN